MEISQYLDFDFLIRFLEGLQKFLGENSEILIIGKDTITPSFTP